MVGYEDDEVYCPIDGSKLNSAIVGDKRGYSCDDCQNTYSASPTKENLVRDAVAYLNGRQKLLESRRKEVDGLERIINLGREKGLIKD